MERCAIRVDNKPLRHLLLNCFGIEAGYERLGYQIIEENKYINPLEFMETYG